jgi:hypothetical protein
MHRADNLGALRKAEGKRSKKGGLMLKRLYGISIALFFAAAGVIPCGALQAAVTGTPEAGYHMKVVSRSTQAIDYRHKGTTKTNIRGTDLMPEAKGKLEVEGKPSGVKVEIEMEHMQPANGLAR